MRKHLLLCLLITLLCGGCARSKNPAHSQPSMLGSLSWVPSGTYIAVRADSYRKPNDRKIIIVTAATGQITAEIDCLDYPLKPPPEWAPAGPDRLAYVIEGVSRGRLANSISWGLSKANMPDKLCIVSPMGQALTSFSGREKYVEFCWSPAGDQIALQGVAKTATSLHILAASPGQPLRQLSNVTMPMLILNTSWQNGGSLISGRRAIRLPGQTQYVRLLDLVDSANGKSRPLVYEDNPLPQTQLWLAAWDVDGKAVLLASDKDFQTRLYRMALTPKAQPQPLPSPGVKMVMPCWSHDRQKVAFLDRAKVTAGGCWGELKLWDLKTKRLSRLTSSGDVTWFDFSPDDKQVALVHNQQHLGIIDLATGTEKPLWAVAPGKP